jgi:hypothetical protein
MRSNPEQCGIRSPNETPADRTEIDSYVIPTKIAEESADHSILLGDIAPMPRLVNGDGPEERARLLVCGKSLFVLAETAQHSTEVAQGARQVWLVAGRVLPGQVP